MKNNNLLVRKKICSNLTEQAIKFFKPEPPFDRIPSLPEVNGYYYLKFIEYYHDLPVELRNKLIAIIPKIIDWALEMQLINPKLGFIDKCPEEYIVLKEFDKWIRQKQGIPAPLPDGYKIEKMDTTKIIKNVVSQKLEDFIYKGFVMGRGAIFFAKKQSNVADLWIIFNKGKYPGTF